MKIPFKKGNDNLTIGIELEFQVIDTKTKQLVPRAKEIISLTKLDGLSKELFQSTLELISPPAKNLKELEIYFNESISTLINEAATIDLEFAGTGTHPMADYRERLITPTTRYLSLEEKNKWMIRRMAVYGMHMHLGMNSEQACVRFHKFYLQFVPHLIALSASSPFWSGIETEIAACRPTMYEALPTAGIPYHFHDWQEYEKLIDALIKTESIESFKDLWWDIRPSPNLGTLEIRVCDGPATRIEMLAIAAFVQCLGFWFENNQDKVNHLPTTDNWKLRENKWRAIRNGLDGKIIIENALVEIRADIFNWLDKLHVYYKANGYENYQNTLINILKKGNSSFRQTKIYRETQSLEAVIENNLTEFRNNRINYN